MKFDNIKAALKARVASLNLNLQGAAVTVPIAAEKTAKPIEQEKPPVDSQFDNIVIGTKAKPTTKKSGKISSPQIQLIPTPTEKSKTPTDKPTRKPATRKQNPATDIPLENIEAIVAKHLKAGRDYDRLPNTIKPTLLKSGAEILSDVFGFRTTAKVINRIADYDKQFVLYEVCVTVVDKDGNILAEGLGSCNSRERKYLKTDFATNLNTVLKIAKKRAFVDAILTATHASKVFTQDIEDIVNLQLVKSDERNNTSR